MWGLIFFRLTPQTHRFILVVLVRSFIVSLVPILPDAVYQLDTLQFVLDAFATACTIVVLGITVIAIEDADIVYVCGLATISFLFMFLAVPVVIFVELVAITTRFYRKHYGVFLVPLQAGEWSYLAVVPHGTHRGQSQALYRLGESHGLGHDHVRTGVGTLVVLSCCALT